jgi:hypothetical protein
VCFRTRCSFWSSAIVFASSRSFTNIDGRRHGASASAASNSSLKHGASRSVARAGTHRARAVCATSALPLTCEGVGGGEGAGIMGPEPKAETFSPNC